jgi:hypothetical protein
MLMRWLDGIPLPKLERKLILDLQLPENSEFGPRIMRCRAEVVRVSPCEGASHLVALRILSMRFMKQKNVPGVTDLASMPVAANLVS